MLIGFREKEEAGGLDTFKRKWEIKSVKKEVLTPSEISGVQVTGICQEITLKVKTSLVCFALFSVFKVLVLEPTSTTFG